MSKKKIVGNTLHLLRLFKCNIKNSDAPAQVSIIFQPDIVVSITSFVVETNRA